MSDAKKPDEKAADHAAPAAVAPKSKMIPILVGFNSLLLVGVLAFMGLQVMKGAHAEAAEKGSAEHGEKKKEEHTKKDEKEDGEKKEKKEGEGAEGSAPVNSNVGQMVKIADFVVHLRNPEVDRYARMSFEVEVIGDSDKEMLNSSTPKIRDAFITYLSDRTVEEMRGSEGLGRVKEALQARLRQIAPDARVRGLYISDFVIQ